MRREREQGTGIATAAIPKTPTAPISIFIFSATPPQKPSPSGEGGLAAGQDGRGRPPERSLPGCGMNSEGCNKRRLCALASMAHKVVANKMFIIETQRRTRDARIYGVPGPMLTRGSDCPRGHPAAYGTRISLGSSCSTSSASMRTVTCFMPTIFHRPLSFARVMS